MSDPSFISTPPSGDKAPTPWRLFLIFSRIGLTSFGGGLSGWLLREFVRDRPWLTEDEFLTGLSLSQALPGVNVKNMAIWIGYRLAGTPGAVAGVMGIVAPPTVVILLLGALFSSLAGYSQVHVALAGAAAGAIGLSFSMAITAVCRVRRRFLPYLFLVVTFIAVGILHWPLVWVVLIEGVLGVSIEYQRLRLAERQS